MRRLARLLDGDVKVFLLASNTRATSPGGRGGKVKEDGVRPGMSDGNGGQRSLQISRRTGTRRDTLRLQACLYPAEALGYLCQEEGRSSPGLPGRSADPEAARLAQAIADADWDTIERHGGLDAVVDKIDQAEAASWLLSTAVPLLPLLASCCYADWISTCLFLTWCGRPIRWAR